MVECAGLEIPCTFSTYRGFESHPLRQISSKYGPYRPVCLSYTPKNIQPEVALAANPTDQGDVTSIPASRIKLSVGVLLERRNHLVPFARTDDSTPAPALAGFTADLNSIAAPMRHSLTFDKLKDTTHQPPASIK